ncbi:exported hypothetical protein [Nocardioides sp. AX2bis]|nr:exported hypothetical protein [Nocardioides sp. AX2bis]
MIPVIRAVLPAPCVTPCPVAARPSTTATLLDGCPDRPVRPRPGRRRFEPVATLGESESAWDRHAQPAGS